MIPLSLHQGNWRSQRFFAAWARHEANLGKGNAMFAWCNKSNKTLGAPNKKGAIQLGVSSLWVSDSTRWP
ncbi:unknow (plasmid) [Vibrio campbellii]|nr:unknow [Vibrio campbellii]